MTEKTFLVKKPKWLRRRVPTEAIAQLQNKLASEGLKTVCELAACPNIGECFRHQQATFMILGDSCTRNCKFCNVQSQKPEKINPFEADRLAKRAKIMAIKYLVITSPTRDDLKDGGANHYLHVSKRLVEEIPELKLELLVPDFRNSQKTALRILNEAQVAVFGHNIETTYSLHNKISPQGDYRISLKLLELQKNLFPEIPTKSGLIVGLGEERTDLELTIKDLQLAGISILTIGQYLQPRPDLWQVKKYYRSEEFHELKDFALSLGIEEVLAGTFVRSSYRARESFESLKKKNPILHDSE